MAEPSQLEVEVDTSEYAGVTFGIQFLTKTGLFSVEFADSEAAVLRDSENRQLHLGPTAPYLNAKLAKGDMIEAELFAYAD
ncbi:hypothetical protein KY316_00600, partial [Candidatus Woesearchaeota archaeon]|nr:hypothetical protein [Candidatus Woesearchaeota archaeon]